MEATSRLHGPLGASWPVIALVLAAAYPELQYSPRFRPARYEGGRGHMSYRLLQGGCPLLPG